MSLKYVSALTAAASAATYNYAQNGADWGSVDAQCNGANQSPIALYSKDHKDFDYEVLYKGKSDIGTFDYTNQKNMKVAWLGHTSQATVATGTNTFESKIAEEVFGADTKFNAAQFHFHAASEHTIDGKRFDLEMHTVHLPTIKKNEFFGAVVGIIFDVEDYNADLWWAERRIIDTFFESLQWDNTADDSVTVDLVAYGDLMEMINHNQRWVYKGSLTTPPCTTNVYWNVLSTVYPIQQKHLDLFKAQLNRGEDGALDERGNYRIIQPINGQDVRYVDGWAEGDDEGEAARAEVRRLNAAALGLIVATFVGVMAVLVIVCIRTRQTKTS